MPQSTHENFAREETLSTGPDRNFGWTIAGALLLVSAVNGWHVGRLWPWTLFAALLFAGAAWIRPGLLHPLNRAWTKLGLLLHGLTNPLVMGILYYGTIVPTGLVMRLRGKDPLRLQRDARAESYWIARVPGPSAETMKDQF